MAYSFNSSMVSIAGNLRCKCCRKTLVFLTKRPVQNVRWTQCIVTLSPLNYFCKVIFPYKLWHLQYFVQVLETRFHNQKDMKYKRVVCVLLMDQRLMYKNLFWGLICLFLHWVQIAKIYRQTDFITRHCSIPCSSALSWVYFNFNGQTKNSQYLLAEQCLSYEVVTQKEQYSDFCPIQHGQPKYDYDVHHKK